MWLACCRQDLSSNIHAGLRYASLLSPYILCRLTSVSTRCSSLLHLFWLVLDSDRR